MTLTVPEAARRTGRNPETIRRWIREGKLRSRKVGTQHVIDEDDLADACRDGVGTPLPAPDPVPVPDPVGCRPVSPTWRPCTRVARNERSSSTRPWRHISVRLPTTLPSQPTRGCR